MPAPIPHEDDVTGLLRDAAAGDVDAERKLYGIAYDELRRIAKGVASSAAGGVAHTTTLVHEAYLKLVAHGGATAHDREHFLALAARAMRQILIDHLRGSGRSPKSEEAAALDELAEHYGSQGIDLVVLADVLEELRAEDPHMTRLAELRVFLELEMREVAELLGQSLRLTEKQWSLARAWIRRRMTRWDGA